MTQQPSRKTVIRKSAIERLIKSDDGKELVKYLGDICLRDLGVPAKDALGYAFNEGKRSVFLAILQMAEMDLSEFVHSMVKREKEI